MNHIKFVLTLTIYVIILCNMSNVLMMILTLLLVLISNYVYTGIVYLERFVHFQQ